MVDLWPRRGQNADMAELWSIGVRTGLNETGDHLLGTGGWDELVERVKLFTLPNGTYAVVEPNRRCVFKKSGNYGIPDRPGTLEIIEDKGPTMRVRFDLKPTEPFSFVADGVSYRFSSLRPLAEKRRTATKVSEYVFKLPDGRHVYLTVVADEDQNSAFGVERGWYVAEIISDKDAEFLINALALFTKLYRK